MGLFFNKGPRCSKCGGKMEATVNPMETQRINDAINRGNSASAADSLSQMFTIDFNNRTFYYRCVKCGNVEKKVL